MNTQVEVDEGGPAFPTVSDGVAHPTYFGVSLRDYFAAHAPPMTDQWLKDSVGEHYLVADAAWRYRHADWMIAARKEGVR